MEFHTSLVRQWWLFTVLVYIAQQRPHIDLKTVSDYNIEGKDWAWVDAQAIKSKWSFDAHFVKGLRAMKEAAQTWGDTDLFYLHAAVKMCDNFGGWKGFYEE